MRILAALAAVLAVAACGNQPDQGQVLDTLKAGVFKKNGAAAPETPQQVAADMAAALQNSDLPLATALVEAHKRTAILTRIEVNGAYGTWASSDRRTIIMRDGMVTGTRGLGNDLMSVETGGLSALIAARREGTGVRKQQYLDGQNHTIELVADCTVQRAGAKQIRAGTINSRATTMVESCVAGGTQFQNSYDVDGRGYALRSRQWLGPVKGYVNIQVYRR
jgi:hypothetical protein